MGKRTAMDTMCTCARGTGRKIASSASIGRKRSKPSCRETRSGVWWSVSVLAAESLLGPCRIYQHARHRDGPSVCQSSPQPFLACCRLRKLCSADDFLTQATTSTFTSKPIVPYGAFRTSLILFLNESLPPSRLIGRDLCLAGPGEYWSRAPSSPALVRRRSLGWICGEWRD